MAQKQEGFAEQRFKYGQSSNVSKEMIRAGTAGRSRIRAGLEAAWKGRTSSMYGEDTTNIAKILRLFGKQDAAKWYDRFFAKETAKDKKKREKAERTGSRPESGSGVSGVASIKATLRQHTGMIIALGSKIDDVSGDVRDIKSLLMPKFFTAKGKKGSADEGDSRIGMYNPLAPQGEQIKVMTEKGALTGTRMGKGFKDSALQMAALETAKLALKIKKDDEEKSALKLKRAYKDPNENDPLIAEDPVNLLRIDMNKKFEELNKKMDEKKGIMGKMGEFLKDWWALSPFLGFFKILAKLGFVGLAGLIGVEVGTWIYDKFGTQILDAVFWIKDKWAQLSDWFNNFSLEEFFLPLTAQIRKVTDFLRITKSDEDYKKKEAKNAKAGRTRGAISSPKGPSMDESIELYDKRAKDDKLTPKERAANAQVRDNLINQKMQRAAGAPVTAMPGQSNYQATTGQSTRGKRREKSIPAGESGTLSKKSSYGVISGQEDIKQMIMRHEGVKYRPYQDSLGLWTVGVGHLIGDGKTLPPHMDREFSKEEVRAMFEEDYAHHRKAAEKMPGFNKLNEQGQGALTDLTFNMGPAWMKKFPSVAKALSENPPNVEKAAQILEGSKWFRQVGDRGPIIVDMIRAGLDSRGITSPIGAPTSTASPDIRMASATTITPTPVLNASNVEGESRSLSAAKEQPTQVAMVAPTTVNNTTNNTTKTPPRPMPKASATSRDDSFIRTAFRDTIHPALS